MTNITLICVGKLKEPFYTDAVAEYAKRLSPYCKLSILELSEEKLPPEPSQAQIDAALRKEAQAIRAKIPRGSRVVAMCVEGQPCSSEELAVRLERFAQSADKHLVFLIGSSNGLDGALKAEAQARMSMSPMTFPHHLFRVMLLEQLYRGFKIGEGSSYHK